jgi:hypothetical protein
LRAIIIGYSFETTDKIWEDTAAVLLDELKISTNFCYWVDGFLYSFGNTFKNGQAEFKETNYLEPWPRG